MEEHSLSSKLPTALDSSDTNLLATGSSGCKRRGDSISNKNREGVEAKPNTYPKLTVPDSGNNKRHRSEANDGVDAEDEDEELNIDRSYAPSPINDIRPGEDHEPIPYTRFTPEEMAIVRKEAHTLGLALFLQEYVSTRGLSVRSLLEVFTPQEIVISDQVPDLDLLPLLRYQLTKFYRNRPKLQDINTIDDVVELLKKSKRIMVLTGAGVSVSCGIPDFRSPTGIYTRLNEEFGLDDPQQMFDIEYFREMPELFYSFAKELYPYNFNPAPSHAFIRLLEDKEKLLRNYTQNIDTLEHVEGIKNVLNCHGSFASATCIKCGHKRDGKDLEADIMAQRIAYCPICDDAPKKSPSAGVREGCEKEKEEGISTAALLLDGGVTHTINGPNPVFNEEDDDDDDEDDGDFGVLCGIMKPDITFFGEMLPDKFDQALLLDREEVDLLLVMGSSLKVAPVSDIMGHLPHVVPQIVINKTPILHLNFDVQLLGDADDIVAYLANKCGWELKHSRIPGSSTSSSEFAEAENVAPVPRPPPAVTVPVRTQQPKEGNGGEFETAITEKTYTVPDHWHPFPSAVITGKDLVVASGDSQVRLAVDSSDEEEEFYTEDELSDTEQNQPTPSNDESDSSEGLSKDISNKAAVE